MCLSFFTTLSQTKFVISGGGGGSTIPLVVALVNNVLSMATFPSPTRVREYKKKSLTLVPGVPEAYKII